MNHTPHLGEIQQIAYQLIDEIFQPFFPVPRMLKMMVVSVLTAQYRITPLEKRKQQRIRIPHDPDFGLALKFLDVRACLEPALQTTWEDWDYAYGNVEQEDIPIRRKRRSRPRKRGPLQRIMKPDFVGPDLSLGPLPTIFYFALSAKESLHQDPFNQPVAVWQTYPVRIFSITLPEHEGHLDPKPARLAFWNEEIAKGAIRSPNLPIWLPKEIRRA